MLKTKEVLGLPFIDATMSELVKELRHRIDASEKTFVVTANPEIVMYSRQDKMYEQILRNADMLIPDGIGIIIASKVLGSPLQERLTGFDLMQNLLQLSHRSGYSIYCLGAEEEVIRKAVECIRAAYPNVNIVGYHHGFFDWNDSSLVKTIKAKNPDIVLVGLGFPRQEQWISQHLPYFQKGIFIGVGGSFDVWAGKVQRAPEVWQKWNVEWLYRLLQQPSRWRRMLALPRFMVKVMQQRLTGRHR
jgi:N-acetylglucosaminyldiphosphoundecaprenol N-acetyl-beta-D-mannosaminyltransferase